MIACANVFLTMIVASSICLFVVLFFVFLSDTDRSEIQMPKDSQCPCPDDDCGVKMPPPNVRVDSACSPAPKMTPDRICNKLDDISEDVCQLRSAIGVTPNEVDARLANVQDTIYTIRRDIARNFCETADDCKCPDEYHPSDGGIASSCDGDCCK